MAIIPNIGKKNVRLRKSRRTRKDPAPHAGQSGDVRTHSGLAFKMYTSFVKRSQAGQGFQVCSHSARRRAHATSSTSYFSSALRTLMRSKRI